MLQTNNLVPPQFQLLHGNVDEENLIDPFIESETIIENFSKLALQHEAQVAKLKVNNDTTIERIENNAQNEGGGDGSDDNSSTDDTPAEEPADDTNTNDGNTDTGGEPDGEDDLFGEGGDDNPLG